MTNLVTASNDSEFQQLLSDAGDRPVLLDFFAEWCGPCKTMAPALNAYAQAHPEVFIVKVDVDSLSDTAMAHSVRSIPTFEVVRDGKIVGKRVGALSASQLTTFMDGALAA